jgi:hypothetical protein
MQCGVSFTVPRTRAEASRLIDELRRRPANSAAARQRDVRAIQAAMATGRGDATRVREELEVTGYGASAIPLAPGAHTIAKTSRYRGVKGSKGDVTFSITVA